MKLSRQITAFFIILCMVFTLSTAFAADFETVDLHFSGYEDYTMAYGVLELVNSERAANGLSPLSMDVDLLSTAMQRAAENAIYFDHTRPDGSDCFTAFPGRFNYSARGENIAVGQESAAEVMTSWMNSPGHRSNILSDKFKSIGIGCFYQYGILYWVQVFSSETAIAPSPRPEDRTVNVSVTVAPDYCDLFFDLEDTETEGYSQIYLVNENTAYNIGYILMNNDNITYRAEEGGIAEVTEGGLISPPSKMGFVIINAYIDGTYVYNDVLYYSDHEFMSGDVNADGDINNTDLILVARYVVSIPAEIDPMAADVNYDNNVNNADLILIARHIVGLTKLDY